MRFLIAFGFVISIFFPAFPQAENSAFTLTGRGGAATAFAKDYQTIGINPANLGFLTEYEGKKVTIGLAEGGFSFYTSGLTSTQLSSSLFDFGASKFTYKQKQEGAKNFENKPINFSLDYTLIGASVQIDKIGGFAFSIRDKMQVYAVFGDNAADLLFMGRASTRNFDLLTYSNPPLFPNVTTFQNIPPSNGYSLDTLDKIKSGISTTPGNTIGKAMDGSKINMQWTREFNLAYGNRILKVDAFEIYGGVGLKYILGYAAIDIESKNGKFTDSYASFSPGLGIKIGDGSANNTEISGNFLTPTGRGFGVDLGLSFKYYGFTAGVSVVNLGSMTWNGNMYQPIDGPLSSITGAGLQNYNLLNQVDQFTSDQGPIKWRPAEARTVSLPGSFRAGLNYNLKEKLNIGADIIIPLNKVAGSLQSNLYAAGLDYKVVKWFRVSAGFSTGGNLTGKFNVPFGILFIVGMNGLYEFGISTRDITSFFIPTSPNVSLTSGFLRFRF